jgi:uncharacterized protein with PQ loop repeat
MMELFSIVGSTCLALCSLPELFRTVKNKKCGIGYGMLNLWLIGEILVFIYLMDKKEYILCINYSLNILIVSVLYGYKIKYKDNP